MSSSIFCGQSNCFLFQENKNSDLKIILLDSLVVVKGFIQNQVRQHSKENHQEEFHQREKSSSLWLLEVPGSIDLESIETYRIPGE